MPTFHFENVFCFVRSTSTEEHHLESYALRLLRPLSKPIINPPRIERIERIEPLILFPLINIIQYIHLKPKLISQVSCSNLSIPSCLHARKFLIGKVAYACIQSSE
jgi:hypothetical protein